MRLTIAVGVLSGIYNIVPKAHHIPCCTFRNTWDPVQAPTLAQLIHLLHNRRDDTAYRPDKASAYPIDTYLCSLSNLRDFSEETNCTS